MVRTIMIVVLGMVIVAACSTSISRHSPMGSVSVRYDPYDFSIDDLRAMAMVQCKAKGGSIAVRADRADNEQEIRWSYMNFDCYRNAASKRV